MANWILLGVPSLEEEFSSIVQTSDVRCKGGGGGGVPVIVNACSTFLECSDERDLVMPI